MNLSSNKYTTEIDQVGIDAWTELLHRFYDASIYQTWQYGAVRWGQKNISHLILKNDGEIVAAAQLRIVRLPVFKGGIAYLRWGPIWKLKGKENNLDDLHKMIRSLYEEYVLRRRLYLRILPNAFNYEENANEIRSVFEVEGFQYKPSTYRTFMLDLSPAIEELKENLSQKWRKNLRISEGNNLKLIEGFEDRLFDDVCRLYSEMLARKVFVPGIDPVEFREIQKQMSDPEKMKIILCESNGKIIAAHVHSNLGEIGIPHVAATANDGLDLRGSFFLQWRVVQWMKEQGCKWYDLGGIDPVKNPGGYQFKSGLAGKSGKDVWQLGQFDACSDFLSSFSVNTTESFVKIYDNVKVILSKVRKVFK